ncbi:hypothetical protein DQ238_15360 [Geodermatophilus sp. TF02-6]|uniref:helix-hairpin-helix domain-containing protein n=1 Tax=Geodermatophilus sp. TF02-6 TaxID=2250575 RepID=UPI000DE806FC|nr:DNA-directed RNA polymerase subunit alpha C-terminal domain-containing protein [Geodermatophilus sp. TF02-6]RBY77269.1 hypothetical protein DQ238_15360 [Geodermatophilus sp. TF02-6]
MPTRPPGDAPTATIRDLGLPGRAVTALTRAGVGTVDDLAALTRRDLAAVPGLGPGLIAAIRLVVPEPPTPIPRVAASAQAGSGHPVVPADGPGPAEDESPQAPAIPSFDSLRSPRRRTAVDLLVPGPSSPAPAPAAGAPRPAEYADLLRLGVRAVRAAAAAPGRVALWSVRAPVRGLRRLLGG